MASSDLAITDLTIYMNRQSRWIDYKKQIQHCLFGCDQLLVEPLLTPGGVFESWEEFKDDRPLQNALLFYERFRDSQKMNKFGDLFKVTKKKGFDLLHRIVDKGLNEQEENLLKHFHDHLYLKLRSMFVSSPRADEFATILMSEQVITKKDDQLIREAITKKWDQILKTINIRSTTWYEGYFFALWKMKEEDQFMRQDSDLYKWLCKMANENEDGLNNIDLKKHIHHFVTHFYEKQPEKTSMDYQDELLNSPNKPCLPIFPVAPVKRSFLSRDDASSSYNEKEIPPPKKIDFLSMLLGSKQQPDREPSQPADLQLRNYQRELTEMAVAGKNVLICAPTGSGKTRVAIKIALEHLRLKGSSRVAFLVHRVHLVEQQYEEFHRFFGNSYRVQKFSGGSAPAENATSLAYAIRDKDVCIMTADVLLNAFRSPDKLSKLESISVFTLVIFDECHNCTKGHPYNQIMERYFEETEVRPSDVPQIVGLTASPGTDKAKKSEDAFNHLIQLCANLNIDCLQKVTRYEADLEKVNTDPDNQVFRTPQRTPDSFEIILAKLMSECEKLPGEFKKKGFFKPGAIVEDAPENRSHSIYTNYVGKMAKLHLQALDEPVVCRNSVYAVFRFLDVYNRAYKINRFFRSMDAAKFISEQLGGPSSVTGIPASDTEKFLMDQLKRYRILNDFNMEDRVANPALIQLKECVQKQLLEEPNSRIIVFVKERYYTTVLMDVFRADPGLCSIPVDRITGAGAAADSGGNTQNWQKEVLSKFRGGHNKVLFSTTVAEEGLDVAECNLVIRYGHITNETAMIQSKGRARAMKSKYIVIIPAGEEWQACKERVNIYRSELMFEAIKRFTNMTDMERRDLLERKKMGNKYERKLTMTKENDKKGKKKDLRYELRCIRCNIVACISDDFRLVQNMHRFMVNPDNLSKMLCRPTPEAKVLGRDGDYEHKGKVVCADCRQDWGSIALFKHVAYPNLAICNFNLVQMDVDVPNTKIVKKWKDAPFRVDDIEIRDVLERYTTVGNDWMYNRT